MTIKALNTYRIIHKNGTIEDINAEDITTALTYMTTSEEESVVLNISLVKENVRTVVEEPEPSPEPDPDSPDEENPDEDNPPDTETGGSVDFGESN